MIFHKPRTLLWQLGLALMAVQAVAVCILGWYAMTKFGQFTREQAATELQRITPLLVDRYGALVANSERKEFADIDRAVKEDGRQTGLRITIILPDGTVIADSAADPATMENHRTRPEVERALRKESASISRLSATTHQQTMYFARTFEVNGEARAVIRAALPLAVVKAEPGQVVRVVGTAMGVSLLLTFGVIYLVSRQLSHTISRLAEGASRFADGDLAHRIAKPPSSELALLANALNHMAEQLSEQIDLLRSQRSEQQAIQQSMSNGMIVLDLNQRIISVNRAAERLLGIHGETARGRLLQELIREPELNRFVSDAVADRPQTMNEFRLRGPNGAMIQAESEPLRNARDQKAGVLVFINDVTQLRRLESIRSDFAANVSHELRTPITNIKGYVETMIDVGVKDQQQTLKFLEIINRNTARLASIIEDLLALARLEQPDTKTTLERVRVTLVRIVDAAIGQFESEFQAKNTDVHTQVPPNLHIMANPQLLEQALSNLLSNAIRYSPSDTTITVSAQQLISDEVEIAVADQGSGIPAEHLNRIFERFYRVDKARSRAIGGTGLGLSIVKHIALVHGGRVEVESEVGRGSIFRMVLPNRHEAADHHKPNEPRA